MYPTAEIRWFFKEKPSPELLVKLQEDIEPERRIDLYLKGDTHHLGIKWREGKIEIKQRTAQVQNHKLANGISCHIESLIKWSFNLEKEDSIYQNLIATSHWVEVRKKRWVQNYRIEGENLVRIDKLNEGCEVEFTVVEVEEQQWFTIGLEAFSEKREEMKILKKAGDLFFADAAWTKFLKPEKSMSYAEWEDIFFH